MAHTVKGIVIPDTNDPGLSWGANVQAYGLRLGELHLNVVAYGADPTGVADSTAAVLAAVTELGTQPGVIFFPAGIYKISSTITLAWDRQWVRGAGPQASVIDFEPGADATCFKFQATTARVLYQCGMQRVGFFSNDVTHVKTMLDTIDVSEFSLEDVATRAWAGGGTGSIGWITHGRETMLGRRLRFGADRPLVIADNPNHTIDIDLSHFQDCMFLSTIGAGGYPTVEIKSGVNVTRLLFDGYQNWVGGTYGLYWVDTTATGQHRQVAFYNVGTEQGTTPAVESFHIDTNLGISTLLLANCNLDGGRAGMYFRKVWGCTLLNVNHSPSASRVSLDADSVNANAQLAIINCSWNSSSTKVLTNFASRREDYYVNAAGNVYATPPENALYVNANVSNLGDVRWATIENGVRRFVWRGDIAAGANIPLPSPWGFVIAGKTADWMCRIQAHNKTVPAHEYGVATGYINPSVAAAAVALNASGNFVVGVSGTGTAGKLSLVQSATGQNRLYNLTANDLSVLLVLEFSMDSNL